LEEKVLNSDDIAGLGSDPNIAQIMAAMKRNAEVPNCCLSTYNVFHYRGLAGHGSEPWDMGQNPGSEPWVRTQY